MSTLISQLQNKEQELIKVQAEHNEIWNKSSFQRSYTQEGRMDRLSWEIIPQLKTEIEELISKIKKKKGW